MGCCFPDIMYMILLTCTILMQKGGGVSTAFELENALSSYVNNAHEGVTAPDGSDVSSFEEIATIGGASLFWPSAFQPPARPRPRAR